MLLKSVVDKILKEKNRPMRWLAGEMDRSFDGLKLSLINGSLKYNDLLKMARILGVPATLFLPSNTDDISALKNTTFLGDSTKEFSSLKKELSNCQEMIKSLKDQLKDKDKIISLLSKP